ncbi:MAG: hypothetical protein ABIN36_10590 [Ferruginibacter sp.]
MKRPIAWPRRRGVHLFERLYCRSYRNISTLDEKQGLVQTDFTVISHY